MKNQLIVLPNGDDIVDVVAGKPGRGSNTKFFASPITTNTRLGTQINKTRAGKKLGDNASPKSDINLFRERQKGFKNPRPF